MTREEIIQEYNNAVIASGLAAAAGNEEAAKSYALFKAGLSALRPITREQVEKVWRGEWQIAYDERKEKTIVVCSKCGEETVYDFILEADELVDFCPICGSPMTNEAVQIVMERLEALYGQKTE